MLGTFNRTQTEIERLFESSINAQKCIWRMGYRYRKDVCSRYAMAYAREDLKALRKCVELSKNFPVVKIDESVERSIKTTTGEVIKCRLVFSCNLPLKPVTTQRVKGKNGKEYDLKSQTPLPTKEALGAIKSHGKRFDKLALWWVPNEIVAEEVKELDPIIVGKISTHYHGDICFELHRWIDENFEASYWNKEAY